jgi:UDP-N-acetylmuramate dehydrogenase
LKITEQVLIADHTTLRLGGPAARFAVAETEDQVVAAVQDADTSAEPVLVLGGGSNLVVADDGFPGAVIRIGTAGLELAHAGDAVEVTAAAGEDWDELVRRCVQEGLSGIECLSGIPGLTGATPIQNVGAYGQEVAQVVTAVRVYDRVAREISQLAAAECGFGYRTSAFKRQALAVREARAAPATATGRYVVLRVTFRLAKGTMSAPVRYAELARSLDVPEGARVPLADARAAVLALRRGKGMLLDPADPDTRSAGSFFTNPVVSAAQFADIQARMAGSTGLGRGAHGRGAHGGGKQGGGEQGAAVPHWPAEAGQVKVSAAWLIEQAGFGKGYAVDADPEAARISTKHTLALTSPANGTTKSLIRLARQVRDGVQAAFGIELMNEPTLVGVEL